jgi:hypothetical protein
MRFVIIFPANFIFQYFNISIFQYFNFPFLCNHQRSYVELNFAPNGSIKLLIEVFNSDNL